MSQTLFDVDKVRTWIARNRPDVLRTFDDICRFQDAPNKTAQAILAFMAMAYAAGVESTKKTMCSCPCEYCAVIVVVNGHPHIAQHCRMASRACYYG